MAEPLTITAAAPLIRAGELTPSELLEQCLRRIDVYEPAVKAWAFLDRDRSRREAAALTDEIKQGRYRGPLHGIPVGVKDIIDVFDMPTGCGSKLWANSYARRDATCVERLRQAGALILGKTVTTPYAYLDPPPTRNPWNLDRTPGGSSSGSAAAVACGTCLAALGTQTGGSLIRPASYCGVCCLKPTHGRVSTAGVLPLAPSLDHIGVMANGVRDLAIVFEAMCGEVDIRRKDWDEAIPDCQHAIDTRAYQSLALVRGLFHDLADPDMRSALAAFAAQDRREFPQVVPIVPPASFAHVHRWHRTVMCVQAAGVHAERLERHPDDYPPRIRELIEDGLRRTAREFDEAWEQSVFRRDEVDLMILRHRVWVSPAATGPAPTPETTGDPSMNSPWSFTGLPVISVPFARTADGMPLAVQLTGEYMGESRVFAMAANMEAATDFERRLPPVPA